MNIYVFSHKQMRSQLVNWFLLVLALSDLCVLVSSFFVFSLPVVAEYMEDYELVSLSPKLLVMFYPVAHSSHTTSVYLTILVSVHRYLGVCHPFLIRRISSRSVVRTIILVAIVFAFLFDLPRWFELENVPCLSEIFNRPSEMVLPTYFYGNYIYSIVYRNAAYTIVMFMVPFVILTWVNYRIISTLKASKKLRRTMTQIQGHADSEKACFVQHSTNNNNHIASTIHNSNEHRSSIVSLTKMAKITRKFSGPYMKSGDANERKENGITIMLVAMVTGFLMFNLLAFINNILEFFEDYKQSELYTMLVETGTLLVNLNGAITIVIYMVFGSKYRAIFLNAHKQKEHKYKQQKIDTPRLKTEIDTLASKLLI
uniref:G-protein coupled receptors family 1 profile domain-containing protein n=1 Tax=Acrobeloides nanus TaxID=290746 RepID=A0A914CIK9_9BILA